MWVVNVMDRRTHSDTVSPLIVGSLYQSAFVCPSRLQPTLKKYAKSLEVIKKTFFCTISKRLNTVITLYIVLSTFDYFSSKSYKN